jgi:hypothetical protein
VSDRIEGLVKLNLQISEYLCALTFSHEALRPARDCRLKTKCFVAVHNNKSELLQVSLQRASNSHGTIKPLHLTQFCYVQRLLSTWECAVDLRLQMLICFGIA